MGLLISLLAAILTVAVLERLTEARWAREA